MVRLVDAEKMIVAWVSGEEMRNWVEMAGNGLDSLSARLERTLFARLRYSQAVSSALVE